MRLSFWLWVEEWDCDCFSDCTLMRLDVWTDEEGETLLWLSEDGRESVNKIVVLTEWI